MRVAHITDQHFGRVTSAATQHAARALVNEARPDLVVITGDFVAHGLNYLDQLGEVLGGIDAPVYGVLGNHDHWCGADEVRRALARAGVEVLDNAHTMVEVRGQRLQLVGLDDAYTGHADRDKALRGLRRDLPSLGLSHIAEEADALWAAGVPLVLSGHTHAGQVTLARMHELTLGKVVGHRYIHGLYGCRRGERQEGAVYVGAGVGAAVMPLRLGERARREITLFELGTAPGTFDEHHTEQPPHPGRDPSARTRAKRAAQVVKKRQKREKQR
ncbi:MAG: metallophosphoesterase family protein [Deltaproteobacteria bacterium]|nr:metallophosphoesterase family protein [Deltaproteobacteria bacterium]MCB9787426.1 metallophosphoesterase family protein [Deltaproteobacteria bacterium]